MARQVQSRFTPRTENAPREVARLAATQWGVVSRRQLCACGLSEASVARWIAGGRLHRVHRGVYAVGHPGTTVEGRLAAALLYAAPGAALAYQTSARWMGFWPVSPGVVHVATARRQDHPATDTDVRVHRVTRVERVLRSGMPCTSAARALLDLSRVVTKAELRRALADADYRGLLDRDALAAELAGRPRGATALRRALAEHMPELAYARSELERRFLSSLSRREFRSARSTSGSPGP